MATFVLWHQGRQDGFNVLRCDDSVPLTLNESKHIAAEYERGYFTYTAVLNPNIEYDPYGRELWQKTELEKVKVGDFIMLGVIPPMHLADRIFVFNTTTEVEHSSLQSMGGVTVSAATVWLDKPDVGSKDLKFNGAVRTHGTTVFPAGTNPTPQFNVTSLNTITPVNKWLGFGLRVDALPSGRTLGDIVGRIVVGMKAQDFNAQIFQ